MITIQVEISHTNFSKVSGMVFVKVDAMMMHTTGITATARMLAVFAWRITVLRLICYPVKLPHKELLTNTTMTVTDMSTKLSGLFSFFEGLQKWTRNKIYFSILYEMFVHENCTRATRAYIKLYFRTFITGLRTKLKHFIDHYNKCLKFEHFFTSLTRKLVVKIRENTHSHVFLLMIREKRKSHTFERAT